MNEEKTIGQKFSKEEIEKIFSKKELMLFNYLIGPTSISELEKIRKKSKLSLQEFNFAIQNLQKRNMIILVHDKQEFDEPYFIPHGEMTGPLWSIASKYKNGN